MSFPGAAVADFGYALSEQYLLLYWELCFYSLGDGYNGGGSVATEQALNEYRST